MGAKSLPLRLERELYDKLKDVASLVGAPMVEVVREALKDYLPRVAASRANEMERRLIRLREIAQDPDAMQRTIEATAEAEATEEDVLEEKATVVVADRAAEGELAARVKRSLA